MALGVKRALGILQRLRKNESSDAPIWNLAPYVVIRGQVTSPCSALTAQRIWSANETMSYDHASATCVCFLCEYTHCNTSFVHSFVIWIVLLLVLWRITRNTISKLAQSASDEIMNPSHCDTSTVNTNAHGTVAPSC